MKAQCIQAVAEALGRALDGKEASGIEERVLAATRQLAVQDRERFSSLSQASRLKEAAALAAKYIQQDAATAQRQAQVTVATHARNEETYQGMKAAGMDPQDALDRMLYENHDGKTIGMPLETRIHAVAEDYRRRLSDTMASVVPKFFGWVAHTKGAADFVHEMFGEDTGSATAKKAAAEWRKISDAMAEHFKDAGGVLHRLADWRFPQTHDQVKVFAAGAEKWVASIMDKVDRKRYVDDQGRLMNDAQMKDLLTHAWDTISSGGANNYDENAAGEGKSTIANSETDHRVIHFKDAQSYLDYQKDYGTKDMWSTLNGGIDRMAKSIALMEHFGPNADKEFNYWNILAAKEARTTKGAQVQPVKQRLDQGYRLLAGYSNGVANAAIARGFDEVRNVIGAAVLGHAAIRAIPDLATEVMTARYNQVSPVQALLNTMRLMHPFNSEAKRDLQRAALMGHTSISAMRRFQIGSVGQSFTGKMVNFILQATGHNMWLDGVRGGFASVQMHALAHVVDTHDALSDIKTGDSALFKGKGITAQDFAVWKQAEAEQTKFGKLLTPDAIYRIPNEKLAGMGDPTGLRREAATKLLGMVLSESHMSVAETGAKGRVAMLRGAERGTVPGEMWRSMLQFKTFPWGWVQNHIIQRGGLFDGSRPVAGRAAYIIPLVLGATALGAFVNGVTDLAYGKDPRTLFGANMKFNVRNWIAAFVAGGGFGMYGDLLANSATEDPKNALAELAGPLPSRIVEAGSLALQPQLNKLNSKPPQPVGPKLVNFGKGLTPGANLWYTKAATDHLIFNKAQDALNPGYVERSASKAQKAFGTTDWWQPGSSTPNRPPNLSSLVH